MIATPDKEEGKVRNFANPISTCCVFVDKSHEKKVSTDDHTLQTRKGGVRNEPRKVNEEMKREEERGKENQGVKREAERGKKSQGVKREARDVEK